MILFPWLYYCLIQIMNFENFIVILRKNTNRDTTNFNLGKKDIRRVPYVPYPRSAPGHVDGIFCCGGGIKQLSDEFY